MVKTIESIGALFGKFPILEDGDFVERYPHILLVTAVLDSICQVNEYMKHSNTVLMEKGFENMDDYLDMLNNAREKSPSEMDNYHKRAIDLYREIKDKIYDIHNSGWDGETNLV